MDDVIGGSERILLVDDESNLVKLNREMLLKFGYRVHGRSSSVEASQLFR